ALVVDREVDGVVELMTDAINRNASANRALYPVVDECALRRDRCIEVVVAELNLVADSQCSQRLVGVEEGIIHILRISRIVVRIYRNRVPLAATEAIRLTLVDGFIHDIPNVDLVPVVIDQSSDVVLQPR